MVLLKAGCIWSKKWRMLVAKSNHHYLSKDGKKYFGFWKIFTSFARNMEQFLTDKYNEKVKRKILHALWQEVDNRKNYLENLAKKAQMDAEAAAEEGERLEVTMQSLAIFQAHIRGALKRLWYREWYISLMYARQKLQNFARLSIAKMKVRKIKRYMKSISFKQEEKERENMLDAELESRYYDYHWNSALDIQRCFRGWRGRNQGNDIAVEYQRERALLKLAKVQKLKDR